ncbi:flagellar basal body-associated FliL family protein [Microvirga solisilvae]|uniref:flagellar basal body-associated FliL family protein n=1 Tax=Microvirga solisilvae TaxID=2919498 RepID=UPI001FAE7922|nr:flagellar basal body-associated FliL family protein [Microvirga solisilvae]
MAEKPALPSPGQAERKEGAKSLIVTLGVLTLLSALIGGGFGLTMVANIQKRVEEKFKESPQQQENMSPYIGDIAIKRLSPVVTNLIGSDSDWIRLEASIVYKSGNELNSDVMVAQARQDVLAYLRTVSLAQIQGPSGLLHLREDLNERMKLRSNGVIKELVLETLIVQ